ncbi:hypothetical protein EC973_008806 [Apophysomyces ossiformis]|uniref:Uncharacterized protein n=1 Tax=Apophysomyces ossiformis TaxID=679940 RepID=A0A8H7ETS1_9FUNG|nr:hypothetical protein EC973_008806 [Apophysomyces ossiformis]
MANVLAARIRDVYDAQADLRHSEVMLNSTCIWPALRSSIYAVDKSRLKFYPGEERLHAVQLQLRAAGYEENSFYKADAVVRTIVNDNQLEILLLETSNALDCTTKAKKSFDFYKALYGTVAMLKSVADVFKYADFSLFSCLKLYFVHVSGMQIPKALKSLALIKFWLGKEVRLWSVRNPSEKLFVVLREDKSTVPCSVNDEEKTILSFIQFFWMLKVQKLAG